MTQHELNTIANAVVNIASIYPDTAMQLDAIFKNNTSGFCTFCEAKNKKNPGLKRQEFSLDFKSFDVRIVLKIKDDNFTCREHGIELISKLPTDLLK